MIIWLLKLFFRYFYTTLAWSYDWVAAAVSLNRWKTWVYSILPLLKGPYILELGHGTGHLQARLIQSNNKCFGIDRSAQMSRLARANLLKAAYGHPPKLARASANSLPFKSQSFQTVAATFPTSYIFERDTLAEIHRVLAPDGQLVVLVSAWITGKSLPERAMSTLFRLTGQVPPVGFDFNHLLEIFIQAGFNSRLHWMEEKSSRLLFVIAEKTAILNST